MKRTKQKRAKLIKRGDTPPRRTVSSTADAGNGSTGGRGASGPAHPPISPRKNSRPRFQNIRRTIQRDLLFLKTRITEDQFGCCEGLIFKIQQDLLRLYGVLLEVQGETLKLKIILEGGGD